jgi:hypothetical protein
MTGPELELPDELARIARRLEDERPVPAAAFRGELRARLLRRPAPDRRPARLGALILGYAAAGCLLLLAGAASAAGLGPLGA